MKKEVEIEVSARHIHLSKDDYSILFGAEEKFEEVRELSQKNQFVTDKIVRIIGPKGELPAKFLSPFRDRTQVELSMTDCLVIGISAPYKIAVDDGASDVKISGLLGEITRRAAIVAKRHLHLSLKDANLLKIKDGDTLFLSSKTDRGTVIFHNVSAKIHHDFQLRIHLDTDEGNAAGINQKSIGEIIIGENDISN